MHLILFVLHDPDKLYELMDGWDEAGVSGVTVLPSTGIGRLKASDMLREDLPLMPSLEDILQAGHQRQVLAQHIAGFQASDAG